MPASRLMAAAAVLPLVLLAPAAQAQPAAQLTVEVYNFGFGPSSASRRATRRSSHAQLRQPLGQQS